MDVVGAMQTDIEYRLLDRGVFSWFFFKLSVCHPRAARLPREKWSVGAEKESSDNYYSRRVRSQYFITL